MSGVVKYQGIMGTIKEKRTPRGSRKKAEYSAASLRRGFSPQFFVPAPMRSCASPQPPRPPAAALAPGFRFHPTDEELVGYYLRRKVSRRPFRVDAIAEVDLYKAEPWDLPDKSRIHSRDTEWYFFCSLDKKYASRSRTNRATGSGYWKTTGNDRAVCRGGRAIGMKKTLVFHAGRAPRGERTNWVMHEYRLEDEELSRAGIPQDAFVVCRIFQKRGPGPQNGAQYGAPFVEEDWEDDELPVVNGQGGEGALVGVDIPMLAEMNDDEENKDRGVQNKNAARLVEPDGQGELNASADPDSLVKMCQERGLSDAMDGGKDPDGMGGYNDGAYPNWSLAALNDGYLELNDFAYPVGSNCQESVAYPEEMPSDENFVNGGITCPQKLNDSNKYFSTNDENNLSEQFLLSETGEDNYNVELHDLLGPEPDDWSYVEPADDGLVYFDAPNHYPHADHGLSSGSNSFIDAIMPNSNGPDLMDEWIAYFDATEHMQPCDLKFVSGTSTSNQSNPVAVVTGENLEAYLASSQPLEAVGDCSTSSSLTPDAGKQSSSKSVDILGEPDAQSDNSWDKVLSKRLVSVLDAISPPPAFAAEYPTKGSQSVEHHSAALSSSLTAGMIQVHGVTMSGNGKNWFMQKNADAGFVLSYGMTRNDITGNMAGFERVSKTPGGITVFILRNSFHLLFLSVLFLAASFKIGVYVYTR